MAKSEVGARCSGLGKNLSLSDLEPFSGLTQVPCSGGLKSAAYSGLLLPNFTLWYIQTPFCCLPLHLNRPTSAALPSFTLVL